MSKVISTCPFCGCGCGLIFEIQNQKILSTYPQRSHPVSRGTLCIKGWHSHQFIHHENRLTQPLIREGNSLKPVTWDQAIEFTCKSLLDIKKQQGPDAIGIVGSVKCTNEEDYVLGKLARTVIGTNNIDTSARYYQAPTISALGNHYGCAAATTSITEIEKTDFIFMMGINAKDQSARLGSFVLQKANQDTECIQVDPRELEHSRFFTHLKIKPGTDFWFVTSLLHTIIENGWYDHDVADVQKIKKSLPLVKLNQYEENTGIQEKDIIRIAEKLAKSKKAMFIYGDGITQQANGTSTIQALWNLALLTGHLFKQGSGILPFMPSNNMQGAIDMGLAPDFLPGHYSIQDLEFKNKISDFWQNSIPAQKGLTLQEMLQQAGNGIRAMYIVGENLLWSAPNSEAAKKSLNELDFLVVQDLFLTETAQMADVVFPACSFAEKDGTFTSTERRIQKIRMAINPIGNSKPDWEIISLLANRMGKKFEYTSSYDIFEELSKLIPFYDGIDKKKLDPAGGVQWPLSDNDSSAYLRPEQLPKNATEFMDPGPVTKPAETPDEEFPFTLFTGRTQLHRLSGTLCSKSFTLERESPYGIVFMNNQDARSLQVRSGWQVKIKTRRSEIIRNVIIDNSLADKTIFVPISNKNGLTNILVNDKLENESKIPEMKLCTAKLEAVV